MENIRLHRLIVLSSTARRRFYVTGSCGGRERHPKWKFSSGLPFIRGCGRRNVVSSMVLRTPMYVCCATKCRSLWIICSLAASSRVSCGLGCWRHLVSLLSFPGETNGSALGGYSSGSTFIARPGHHLTASYCSSPSVSVKRGTTEPFRDFRPRLMSSLGFWSEKRRTGFW